MIFSDEERSRAMALVGDLIYIRATGGPKSVVNALGRNVQRMVDEHMRMAPSIDSISHTSLDDPNPFASAES